MPFTFSHPAIALPFKKLKPSWFSSSGLIVGSMAPDFPYFLKATTTVDFGHTFEGIFMLDLPLSFLVAIGFHLWVRNPLILHLPSPLDRKWSDFLSFNFIEYLKRAWLVFASSAFIGILTHLFWDIFTSPKGWIFYLSPKLFSSEVQMGPLELPLYRLIEGAGSVLGLVFLAWLLLEKPGTYTKALLPPVEKLRYWGSILLGTIAIAVAILYMDGNRGGVAYYIIILISAISSSLALTSALYHVLEAKSQKP